MFDQFNNMNVNPAPEMQFSEDEIQNLKEIFDLFDKTNEGSIPISDLDAIMQSLQRDPQEAKELLISIREAQRQEKEES